MKRRPQPLDLAAEHGKLGFDNVPDEPVVDLGIAVNEDIAEGDNTAMLANAGGEVGVELGEPCQGLADDLELALDRSAQHVVPRIVVDALSSGEFRDPCRGLAHIMQVFLGLKPHKAKSWSARPIGGSMDS